jgi:two-component system cell cycle response regulator DivK
MTAYHALIVDDDTMNLEVLGRLLQANGISYSPLSDANKVEATLQSLPQVDMIFLDLEMPHRNGYDLLAALRPLVGTTPIIACSVHTNELDAAYEEGFDAFIGKPLDPKRFSDQLARLTRGESVWEV